MMTRLFHAAVPISAEVDADGTPRQFVWEARLHPITAIAQTWQIDGEWWSPEGHAARTYYAVTTTTGLLCVIYHDFLIDAWFLSSTYD